MANLSKLVASVSLAFLCGGAHAFVSPSPPPGFGGSPGSWTFTPPSPAQQVGQIMRGPGPMIPGAGASSAAYRLGGGAARALAGGIARGLIPGVGIALGVAWLASECIEKQGGSWVLTCGFPTPPQSDGYQYRPVHAFYPGAPVYFSSASQACEDFKGKAQAAVTAQNPTATVLGSEVVMCVVPGMKVRVNYKFGTGQASYVEYAAELYRSASNCPVGWYITPAGCVQNPPPQPITPEEIEERMAPKPLPQTLPPGIPYPLESPSIWNPEPLTETPPGVDPKSRPMRVPQGNPQPVPNTEPQQYRQPVTRWAHSPTESDPWRMDVRPEEITGTDPKGMEQPQSETPQSPDGKKPEQFDLCAEHPDILACQKLDEPTSEDLGKKNVEIAVTPDGGWGASNASCPPPRHLTVQGRDIPIPFDLFCQYMSGIRPIIIALAWLSAGFILVGGIKGGD